LYGVFVLRNGLYLIYVASFFGFHRFFFDGLIDAKHLDWGFNWLVLGATGFSIWYESRFLMEYEPPPLGALGHPRPVGVVGSGLCAAGQWPYPVGTQGQYAARCSSSLGAAGRGQCVH